MTSTVVFPTSSPPSRIRSKSTVTDMSVTSVSKHVSANEVCDFVYGHAEHVGWSDTLERFYETNASKRFYENPFVTATSRSLIADIYTLTQRFSKVDVPKPLAMLCTLFRIKPPESTLTRQAKERDPWFQALRVWTEIEEISESESFDGHRRSIVEHSLHILLLPGIHSDRHLIYHPASPVESSPLSNVDSTDVSLYTNTTCQPHHPSTPALTLPGIPLAIPSPLHFKLRILTRFSFNEQGRITYHRDFWDVKDVIGLVPGASLTQWIGSRLAARSLALAARFLGRTAPEPTGSADVGEARNMDLESGRGPSAVETGSTSEMSPAVAYGTRVKKAHGMRVTDPTVTTTTMTDGMGGEER